MGMALMNQPRRGRGGSSGEGGFSLVEVMIAVLLFLLIVLGMAPLFARAGLSNAAGADSTTLSHFSRSQAEELIQDFFNSAPLTIAGGTTMTETVEYWDESSESFSLDPPAVGEEPRWNRITRIRQFNISDLDDDGLLTDDEALDGNAPTNFVHLKEIEVRVESNRNLLLGGRGIVVKTLKSF